VLNADFDLKMTAKQFWTNSDEKNNVTLWAIDLNIEVLQFFSPIFV